MTKTKLVRVRKNLYINPDKIDRVELKGDGSVMCQVAGEPLHITGAEFDELEGHIDYLNVKKAAVE